MRRRAPPLTFGSDSREPNRSPDVKRHNVTMPVAIGFLRMFQPSQAFGL
jgi:hypothetical protein